MNLVILRCCRYTYELDKILRMKSDGVGVCTKLRNVMLYIKTRKQYKYFKHSNVPQNKLHFFLNVGQLCKQSK